MISKSFCILPWIQTHMEADGRVYPCCLFSQKDEFGNLQKNDFVTILNSEKYKNIRKEMLSGNEIPSCSLCSNLEKSGTQSLRQVSNEKFHNHIKSNISQTSVDGELAKVNLKSLDIRFSNACNFKCRTCNPESSSAWYEDYINLTGEKKFTTILRPTKTKEEFWEKLEPLLPNLENLYIIGGEPLLEPDHYILLEKLIALKNTDLTIVYSTNFSAVNLGKKSVFDYWKHFSNVTLRLSYDGFGEKGEYIRKGMNWIKIEENHKQLQMHPKIKYIITPSVSVLNAFHLPELLNYLLKQQMLTDGLQLGLNIVEDPAYYNIGIFTDNEKAQLTKLYQASIDDFKSSRLKNINQIIHQLQTIINYLQIANEKEKQKDSRRKFLTQTVFLDKQRKEKLLSLFPELISFYQ